MALFRSFQCTGKFAQRPLRDFLQILPKHRNLSVSAVNRKMLVDFELRESPVAGTGNFARQHIPAGTKVWAFDKESCQVYYPDTIDQLPTSQMPSILLKAFLTKDLKKMIILEDGAEYTNHGDKEANVKFGEDDETWVAAKDIEDGEEMVFDYDTFGAFIDADWMSPLCEEYCPKAVAFEKARRSAVAHA